jgi:hypothetical protein
MILAVRLTDDASATRVDLPNRARQAIREEAALRRVSAEHLVEQLLIAIADDDLFAAILDEDGG